MKTVFSTSMVTHVWAQGTGKPARNSDRTLYTDGPALYSYGAHYCVAVWTDYKTADGRRVILVNASPYSVTTSRHVRYALGALSNHTTKWVHVGGLRAEWRSRPDLVAARFIDDARLALSGARKARMEKTRDAARNTIARYLQEAHACAAWDKKHARAVRALIKKDAPPLPAEGETLKAWHARALLWLDKRTAKSDTKTHADRLAHSWSKATDEKGRQCRDAASYCISAAWDARDARERYDVARKLARIKTDSALPDLATITARIEYLKPLAEAEKIKEARSDVWRYLNLWVRDRRNNPDSDNGYYLSRAYESCRFTADNTSNDNLFLMRAREFIDKERARMHVRDSIQQAQSRMDDLRAPMPDTLREARAWISAVEKSRDYLAGFFTAFTPRNPRAAAWLRAQYDAALSALPDLGAVRADLHARQLAENQEKIAAWRAGDGGSYAARSLADWPLLRVRGDVVETSWGAHVPVDGARALQAARLVAMRSGRDYVPREAVEAGHFRLTRARADGSVLIGCHDIPAAECELVAAALGIGAGEVSTVETQGAHT